MSIRKGIAAAPPTVGLDVFGSHSSANVVAEVVRIRCFAPLTRGVAGAEMRGDLMRHCRHVLYVILFTAALALPAAAEFVAFESGQVRPLAMSPDGSQLFAVNTPDNHLEIFDVVAGNLTHSASVPVGLEPVSVAARSNTEVWVVNHLSDSVSVIDLSLSPPRVVRTLLVGDEPRDIVVAHTATAGDRVLITTARRGQNWANHSSDGEPLNSPDDMAVFRQNGIGRALVWLFDPDNLGNNLEGDPLEVVRLFGDSPRALTVSNDGNSVFAAVFHSGNQTTTVSEGSVCNTSTFNINNDIVEPSCTIETLVRPGGLPLPHRSHPGDNNVRPETGLIVKFNQGTGNWEDELGRAWDSEVKFDLPDLDVFEISAIDGALIDSHAGVGTINFNMATNPVSNKVYVSNTEAVNEVRFEGPGIHAAGFKPAGEPATVQGHLHEARITVIDGSTVTPQHLNHHIDYDDLPAGAGIKGASLATPTDMVVTSDGSTLYVAAFGSGKVGIFDTAQLEAGTFTPSSASHIAVGGGPAGLALDEANSRLYVFNRFENSISVVDTVGNLEVGTVSVHNPEPDNIIDGRPFLYDANLTSSNGEASCSSCHVFGDLDSLAWDLGNPDDDQHSNPLPVTNPVPDIGFSAFHPMKGPMTTQTLRGMANHGAMHWRGDRSVGFFGTDATDEVLSFKNFIVAFEGLVGRASAISEAEMDLFTDFILDVFLPPNPIRSLDNTLHSTSISEAAVLNLYNVPATDSGVATCNECHELNPAAGLFGTDKGRSFENETQHFKIAHMRNIYQKIGMFGMVRVPFLSVGDNGHKGDQIRGFGVLHDGSIDTVFRFLGADVFTLSNQQQRDLEALALQFPSNLAPIVGQQITLNSTNAGTVGPRIDLMIARAKTCFDVLDTPGTTECEVIVKGSEGSEDRGWFGELQGPCGPAQTILFRSDRAGDPLMTDAQIRAIAAAGNELTYTCVPPGTGQRSGIDRDQDGALDQDEEDAGSDPADPASVPAGTSETVISSKKILIRDRLDDDESKRKIVLLSKDAGVTPPAPSSADDPRCNGSPLGTVKASVTIASAASGQSHTTPLPCENWKMLGRSSNPKGFRYKDKELDDGTAKVVVWKQGKLRLVLKGKGVTNLDYDLTTGLSQATVDVSFDSNGDLWCMACPPFNGKDGSDGKKFLGKNCAAPLACGP